MGILDTPAISSLKANPAAAREAISAAPANANMWVPVGYRARHPFASPSAQSNGVNVGCSFKMMETAQASGRDLVVEFALFLNSAGESEIPNDVTITRCVFTTTGGYYNVPFLFNGSPSVTVKAGTYGAFRVRSDPLGWVIDKGLEFQIITHVTVASGGVYPLSVIARRTGPWDEGAATGGPTAAGPTTDMTAYGQAWGADSGLPRMFTPAAILMRPKALSSVALFVGDSITVGTGETVGDVAHWDEGWCTRAVRNKWPHYVSGLSGTNLTAWTGSGLASFHRKSVIAGMSFTHLICELGVNDVLAAINLATLQTRWWAAWKQCAAYGRPVYQSTITPATTTSTDNWTTVAGQTVHTNNAVRANGNDWLRDGAPWNTTTNLPAAVGATGSDIVRAPSYYTTAGGVASKTAFNTSAGHPLAGVIEVADAVETARNSGIWAALPGARVLTNAAISSGTATLTSTTAAFTANDVGRYVEVVGAGASGGTLVANISAVTNSTTVTLTVNASTTVSGTTLRISAKGVTADGTHPSGTAGSIYPGGHELIANFVRPQLVAILGADSV